MPSEKNYHSSKLEFLALKWSVTEHFQEYLACAPFVVQTDNNLLTYVLTTPNLNAMRHRSVGMLVSFDLTLEYQNGADNGAADALSWVPICHDCKTVQSLLEGVIVGAADRGEAEASEELLCECMCLENKACVQAAKLTPMHIVDWREAQEADAVLAACRRWLCTCKDTPFPKRDALLKKYLGDNVDTKEWHALFHVHNSLVLRKGLLYVSTMPKGHQGQQRMLALTQE